MTIDFPITAWLALVIGLVAAGLDIAIALAGRRRRQRRQA